MKKPSRSNGKKPVTHAQLKSVLEKPFKSLWQKVDKRFGSIDKRFVAIDQRFDANDKRFVAMGKEFETRLKGHLQMTELMVDRAVERLETKMDKRHYEFMNMIDAFLKRTETNEREILFLGRQHDDLAHYCTAKIGYPAYGGK